MKLDRRTEARDIRERIDFLLQDVGLAHRSSTRIGCSIGEKVLSGGEKKRLAFATEVKIPILINNFGVLLILWI